MDRTFRSALPRNLFDDGKPIPQEWLDGLAVRTKAVWKSAHVLLYEGRYICLDVNVSAPTLEEMESAVKAFAEGLRASDVLPGASVEWWLAFAHGDNIESLALDVDAGRRGFIPAVVRSA